MSDFSTDYLVVGAGATGLAFADTLVDELPDAHITIVDRGALPGGHWNHAYGFVTLHQPSSFYGVNSTPLGSGARDTHGVNEGLYELASGPEVCGYFDTVLRRRLLASGRVRWMPMTESLGDGQLRPVLGGEPVRVTVRRRVVDAAYCAPSIPALRKPKFDVQPGVRVVAPNALTDLALKREAQPAHYAIVGAGKTAMDVGVWLRTQGVPADRITWVVPRDSWLLNRKCTQPGIEFFQESMGAQAAQVEAFATADSMDAVFERIEAAGVMLRIDPQVRPTMFHYATISEGEVAVLRTIHDVVRLGHVESITAAGMTLAQGSRAMPEGTLYIDCTASAVRPVEAQPIFQPGRIVPQVVRAPQPAFSAALIAHLEALPLDDAARNALCQPVPFPDRPEDWPATVLANMRNEGAWTKDAGLRAWIQASRLDGFRKVVDGVDRSDTEKMAVLGRLRQHGPAAFTNLQRLLRAPA